MGNVSSTSHPLDRYADRVDVIRQALALGWRGANGAGMNSRLIDQQRIMFPDSFGTRFVLSIDTEEEFDWAGKLSRHDHGTTSVAAIKDGQRFFARSGVAPLYLVDQPIVDSDLAVDIIGRALSSGEADVGVHLHPWVTPPFDEDVNRVNSYAGNLPEHVERAKIRTMRDLIAARFGRRPVAYRAGRYGIGPNSFRILEEEGFLCDSSVRTMFDYRDDGGPDFRWSGHHPHWVGPTQKLLEIPLTTMFIGHFGRIGRKFYGMAGHIGRMRGILARSGIVERIPFTPEGVPANKMPKAIDSALGIGIRLLSFSFHSPSLAIGHTPYVRSQSDLDQFYRWWDVTFNHCAKRGVMPTTVGDVLLATQ